MAYIQRNQSDLPLTIGETSDFLSAEEQAANHHSGKEKAGKNRMRKDSEAPVVREHWGSKFEFIFSCMAFSVGLGNVS